MQSQINTLGLNQHFAIVLAFQGFLYFIGFGIQLSLEIPLVLGSWMSPMLCRAVCIYETKISYIDIYFVV